MRKKGDKVGATKSCFMHMCRRYTVPRATDEDKFSNNSQFLLTE